MRLERQTYTKGCPWGISLAEDEGEDEGRKTCITQANDSDHRIQPDPSRNGVVSGAFPLDPAGKGTGRWEQYSGRKVTIQGNREFRKVPFTGLSQELTWIQIGSKPKFNVSHRNRTGTHRTAARDPTTKLRFRESVLQKISIAWVVLRQIRKVF